MPEAVITRRVENKHLSQSMVRVLLQEALRSSRQTTALIKEAQRQIDKRTGFREKVGTNGGVFRLYRGIGGWDRRPKRNRRH